MKNLSCTKHSDINSHCKHSGKTHAAHTRISPISAHKARADCHTPAISGFSQGIWHKYSRTGHPVSMTKRRSDNIGSRYPADRFSDPRHESHSDTLCHGAGKTFCGKSTDSLGKPWPNNFAVAHSVPSAVPPWLCLTTTTVPGTATGSGRRTNIHSARQSKSITIFSSFKLTKIPKKVSS